MDTDSTRWSKFRSGSEVRGPEAMLTDARVEKLGYAFACTLARREGRTPDALRLAVGRDDRPSGERLLAALIRGITAADSDVLDCGLCAAPAVFAAINPGPQPVDGAVMVTASAANPTLNGFMFATAQGGLKASEVAELLDLAARSEVPERLVAPHDAATPYFEGLRRVAAQYLEDDALKPLLGMRVIVDARGSFGRACMEFLDSLGVETEGSLTAGGNGIITAPDDPATLAALSQAVLDNRADMGLVFSADGSRAAIVDQDGRAVTGNRLIALIAAMLLDERSGVTFVTDSVTSSGLSTFIAEWGGIHYRFKRGYRNVIDEAVRLNAEGIDCPLAIETSGHAAFRENRFLNDGMYLATRVICEALNRKREGQSLFSLIDDLKEPVESVEIRLPILDYQDWEPEEEAQEIVEIILSHTLTHPEWQPSPDNREGVRITFNLDGDVNNAWFQLRMSVHDPMMVLNAESDVPGGVRRMLDQLYALLRGGEMLDLSPLRGALEE